MAMVTQQRQLPPTDMRNTLTLTLTQLLEVTQDTNLLLLAGSFHVSGSDMCASRRVYLGSRYMGLLCK